MRTVEIDQSVGGFALETGNGVVQLRIAGLRTGTGRRNGLALGIDDRGAAPFAGAIQRGIVGNQTQPIGLKDNDGLIVVDTLGKAVDPRLVGGGVQGPPDEYCTQSR